MGRGRKLLFWMALIAVVGVGIFLVSDLVSPSHKDPDKESTVLARTTQVLSGSRSVEVVNVGKVGPVAISKRIDNVPLVEAQPVKQPDKPGQPSTWDRVRQGLPLSVMAAAGLFVIAIIVMVLTQGFKNVMSAASETIFAAFLDAGLVFVMPSLLAK